jgi:DNA-binding NarL/FixJ family response regulator
MMSRNKMQVLIAGEHFLYRLTLANLLSRVYDIEIVGVTSFSNGTEWTIDNSPPDVAIVDMDAPDDRGLALVRRIKQYLPSIGIVALKSNPHDVELFVALKSQDVACLNKSVKISQLVAVVKQVASTEAVLTAIRRGIVTLD